MVQLTSKEPGQDGISSNSVAASSQNNHILTSSVNKKNHDVERKVSMDGLVKKHTIQTLPSERSDLILCFRGMRSIIRVILRDNLVRHRGIKWNLILKVEMVKENADGRLQYNTAFFRSSMSIIIWKGHITYELNQAFQKLYNSFEEYNNKGSGWRIHSIL